MNANNESWYKGKENDREREKDIVMLANKQRDSGCGPVGIAVASNIRGPQFESSHRQTFK